MLIQFGAFHFSISTAAYDTLTRHARANWARLPILNSNERLQAIGIDNDTIDLVGTVLPEFTKLSGGSGGTTIIDTLRELAQEQKPHRIVTENGTNLGTWVLESLVNQDSRFLRDGTPRKQEFRIRFRLYDDTGATPAGTLQRGTIPRPPDTNTLSAQTQIMQTLQTQIDVDSQAMIDNSRRMTKESEALETIVADNTADIPAAATDIGANVTEVSALNAQVIDTNVEMTKRSADIQRTATTTSTLSKTISTQANPLTEGGKGIRESVSLVDQQTQKLKASGATLDTITSTIKEKSDRIRDITRRLSPESLKNATNAVLIENNVGDVLALSRELKTLSRRSKRLTRAFKRPINEIQRQQSIISRYLELISRPFS